MVDIETLGTKSNSAIISIGAVYFDMVTGELGRSFHHGITIKSNLDVGLDVNAQTAIWWMGQEEALKEWANLPKVTLLEALTLFTEFINELSPTTEDTIIWGNSNRFDMGMLENAYTKFEQKIPWKFRNERDVRTLCSFRPDIKEHVIKTAKASGLVVHDALEDCRLQVEYCHKTFLTIDVDLDMKL